MSANLTKYRNAFDMSQLLLDIIGIDDFPINMIQIIETKSKKSNILLSKLSDFIKWNIRANPTNFKIPSIKDAKCYYYAEIDTFIIVYNEKQLKSNKIFLSA
jgi:uncharacterized protein (UPF0333 family)